MHREKSHARDQDTRLLLWGLWIIRVQYLGCGCQECPLSVCVCARVVALHYAYALLFNFFFDDGLSFQIQQDENELREGFRSLRSTGGCQVRR